MVPRVESLLPLALLAVLVIPCLRFPWLWDDYPFLAHAAEFRAADLLPSYDVLFWRPLSREVWFALLWRVAADSPIVAHVLHLVLAGVAIVLLRAVASRLFGERAGFVAAVLFASLGALPLLIGWASGSQDLFAIVFVLAALHARLSSRWALSLLASACALLSKETAMLAIPIVAVAPALLGERPSLGERTRRASLEWGSYIALLALWAAVHPGLHALLSRRFTGGAEAHVVAGGIERLPALARSALALFNVPIPGNAVEWSGSMTALVLGAAALIAAAMSLAARRAGPPSTTLPWHAVWIAAALAVVPAVLTPLFLRRWEPYYAAFPAIGSTMLLGAVLARLRDPGLTAALLAFMSLGVVVRSQPLEATTTTEPNYVKAGAALARVEEGFRTLYPSFPPGSHLLVSVAGTGSRQIDALLHFYQAPRVWYRDQTMAVLRPNERRAGSRPEFLFRVQENLDIVEIDPFRGGYRTTGEYLPDESELDRPIRAYARALAATGDVERGVASLRMLERGQAGSDSVIDRRYGGMLLIAAGRRAQADTLLRATPLPPRTIALQWIAMQYLESVRDTLFEEAAYPAFGIDPRDVDARLAVLRQVNDGRHAAAALRLARRIQALAPGEPESRAVLEKILSLPTKDRIIPEVGDEP